MLHSNYSYNILVYMNFCVQISLVPRPGTAFGCRKERKAGNKAMLDMVLPYYRLKCDPENNRISTKCRDHQIESINTM